MIKYNNNTINDWFFSTDNIIKVYRNNAICYYKIDSSTPSGQTPCFAVVDDITQYQDTEFEDVYDKATEKWYKLNNLNAYEEYGVYGSGRTITTYDGKLTIDGDYEYIYSGGSWVNLGEVSGGTATLPDVPFTVNFNAKNYNSSTKTLLKTNGQLADVDAVITAGTPTVGDGYLTIASGTRATISGYQTYFNRTNSAPNLTIISKQRTDGNNCHMFANRDSTYNWMYRCYSNKLTLHGASEQVSVAVTTQPVIESVRIDSSRLAIYNNYTDNTSSTQSSFNYGGTNSGKFAIFAGYGSSSGEWFVGDFYWVYMSQSTLTDAQVQQVITYNEGGGGEPIYPIYYDEIQDPPDNVTFTSMTEAQSYECPWVGMKATIDGDSYVFSGDSISGYEWVEKQTDWYTLQDLINTHTVVSLGNKKYNFSPEVNGISYFRVHTDKVSGSGTFVDLYNDNLPSPPYFGIKDNSNITLYTSVDGYSNLKSAADSTSCTWAYWIDANTIEVNAQAIMNDTMKIGFYTGSFSKLLLSFELPTV